MVNGSVIAADGLPVVVDQGPAWLAALLYSPPDWVWPALLLAVVSVACWAGVGYRRHGIGTEVLEEMATAGTVAVCIGGVTAVSTAVNTLGYVGDVVVGVVVGYALAAVVVARAKRLAAEDSQARRVNNEA